MRRATITLRWEGPDKAVREFIEEKIDEMFYELTMVMGDKLIYADSDAKFESRVREREQPA